MHTGLLEACGDEATELHLHSLQLFSYLLSLELLGEHQEEVQIQHRKVSPGWLPSQLETWLLQHLATKPSASTMCPCPNHCQVLTVKPSGASHCHLCTPNIPTSELPCWNTLFSSYVSLPSMASAAFPRSSPRLRLVFPENAL